MEHREFKRKVIGSKTAVLFVHGIVGTPNHFNDLVSLVPSDITVYNLLLDGHGKGVKDFAETSMKKWETQVEKAVDELASDSEEIYIVAHSMGTLFAIDQAIKNRKVVKLFLLAVPIRLFVRLKAVSMAVKVCFDKIKPDDYVAIAAKNCCGVELSKNIFSYIGWISRFIELVGKSRKTRKNLSLLDTPCLAFQSIKDEVVSTRSILHLRKNASVQVVELKESGHYYYDKEDYNLLLDQFKVWIG